MTFRGGMGMGRNGRRVHVGSTDEGEQIELLCGWPEQRDYEPIRPMVLFSGPASERAAEARARPLSARCSAGWRASRRRGWREPFRLRARQAQEEAAGFHEAVVEGYLAGARARDPSKGI